MSQRLLSVYRALGPRRSGFTYLSTALIAVTVFLTVYPIVRVLTRLFFDGGRFTFGVIGETLALDDLASLVWNTVFLTAASGTIALVVGSLFAWLNERSDARIAGLTDGLPMVPFMMPAIAGAVAWVLLLSPRAGLLNSFTRWILSYVGIHRDTGPFDAHTWYALIGVFAIYMVPYVFLVVSAGLRSFDGTLEEQSWVSGASTFNTIRRVTLPGLKPSLVSAAMLLIWTGFGLLSVPLIMGGPAGIDVLSVRMTRVIKSQYPPRMDIAVGLGVFMLIFVGGAWLLQRRVIANARSSTISGKARQLATVRLGRFKWPARLAMLAYFFIAAVLPMFALLLVAMGGYWSASIDWDSLSLQRAWEGLTAHSLTMPAIRNSLRLGAIGATAGVLAAALIAIFVQRRSSFGLFVDVAVKMPATIANIVIAVGFILAFSGAPFELAGTTILLLLAYFVIYLPQASVVTDASVQQVGTEAPEASSLSGAGQGRTFVRIYLPLMLPGIVAAWSLLFVRMAGEFTASAMLAGPANPVIGYQIWSVYENGSVATVASMSLGLVVITTVVVVGVGAFARRLQRWR